MRSAPTTPAWTRTAVARTPLPRAGTESSHSAVSEATRRTTFCAMVDAKSGTTIDVPGLDPSEGDYLVFADPRTAVGYSPRNGALTIYTPAG